jgi:hypothetical protein
VGAVAGYLRALQIQTDASHLTSRGNKSTASQFLVVGVEFDVVDIA